MLRTEWTTVGELRALVHVPDEPVAALVLVDGSGEGCCDDWGGWVERIAELGAVVLTHDRAGCGGSPGNWLTQTLDDRAAEEREALAVLRKHPAVTGPVGLLGFSQGGWVGMLAAADADFLVSLSGPGVGPAAQERHRIEVDVRAAGLPDEQVGAALDWIDERTRRLRSGEDPGGVQELQQRHADQPWYEPATRYFDTARHARVRRPADRLRAGRGAAGRALPGAGAVRRGRPAGAGAGRRRRLGRRRAPAGRAGRVPRRRPRAFRRRPGAGSRPDQPAGAGLPPDVGEFPALVG